MIPWSKKEDEDMGDIFGMLVTGPLGTILRMIYSFTNSYGLSIVLFTVFIKIMLLPLAVKQQKSMLHMQRIQPLLSEIQKKYKKDKEKLQAETVKIYQEHKYNPASGCLPLLVQFPIIIGLYQVIYRPFTYLIWTQTKLELGTIKGIMSKLNVLSKSRNEIDIIQSLKSSKDILGTIIEKLGSIENLDNIVNQIKEYDIVGLIQKVDFNFIGLNLAEKPEFSKLSIIWIIPILAAVTTYISSKLTSVASSSSQQNEQAAQMQNSMMKFFPVMTGFICFSLPAGVGMYWVVSNIFQMIQQFFLNKIFNPTKKEEKK